MLKLKFQYFGHLMQRGDSFEKTLMLERLRAGGEGDDRGWDGWMASPTEMTWIRELVMDRETWCASVHGVAELDMTEWLNWTELNWNSHSGLPQEDNLTLLTCEGLWLCVWQWHRCSTWLFTRQPRNSHLGRAESQIGVTPLFADMTWDIPFYTPMKWL